MKQSEITPENYRLFNEKIETITNEIRKRKGKWTLTSLRHIDYDDISQILLLHICHKIHLWDQTRAIEPWINTIISRQISNLIRNNYSNYTSPCLRCEANDGLGGCEVYETQCSKCPLYRNWEKNKKYAHGINLANSIENSYNEIENLESNEFNLETASNNLHNEMKKVLTISEWRIYECLYIKHLDDKQTAEAIGLKPTNNKNNVYDCKRIRQAKKIIIEKATKIANSDKMDIF